MGTATVSRWTRWFVLASIAFLLAWQMATLIGVPRRTEINLALYGFVLHMVFGKAYSLVPSYFSRELAVPWAPAVHFPFTVIGTVGLVLEPFRSTPNGIGTMGAIGWTLGVVIFIAALLWSVRDNLTGQVTGTSDANIDRSTVDRAANAFVPIAFAYLALGTYETLAVHTALPVLFDGYAPRTTHLLAAGTATMLVFAIGFRLLPRFLVASPPRSLVVIVLSARAVAPILLAGTLGDGLAFQFAAILEAVAIVGFAAAYLALFHRSDRRRVGFYSVLIGVASGVLAALLGLSFAFGPVTSPLITAHLRLNLLGFLGLTIIGVAYQFYPPPIGAFPGASDRTAFASIGCLGGGLLLEVIGLIGGVNLITMVGNGVIVIGAGLYSYIVVGLFRER